MEENVSSKGSSGVDNMSTEGLDSNGDHYLAFPNKHLGHCSWGSQIYASSHQIWLGTVKSEKEPNFQSQNGHEAVLEMIRGGSCQTRFQGLHGVNYGNTESGICGLNLSAMQNRGGFSRKLIFRKMLTPSDVGRLNRIVIPKKNATTCFPEISRRMEEEAKAGVLTEVQVDFFDRTMMCWKFRYCYWKSSQSYVFTRGWSRFVKDKNLKVNDVVAFYLCEVQREGKIVSKFFMIDPVRGEDSGSSSSSVMEVYDHSNVGLNQPETFTSAFEDSSCKDFGLRPEMGSSAFEGTSYHHHHHHVELKPELCSDVEIKRLGKQVMMDSDPSSNVERKGFRLFGVQIN